MTPIIAPAGLQMMSPAFSEDLGPASFSSSMLLMPLSPSQSPRRVDRGSPTGFDNPRPKRMSSLNQRISTSGADYFGFTSRRVILDNLSLLFLDDSDGHRLTELMDENERLKNFVREVCLNSHAPEYSVFILIYEFVLPIARCGGTSRC